MTKAIVIYHSISGNTKKIAEAIFKGMSQSAEHCEIAKIKEVNQANLQSYDLIGIGSPVQKLRELQNVTEFIEYGMKNLDGKHGFAFCTHGATPGHYLSRVVPAMRQRGLIIVGWNDWFASVYHPGVPKPYFTDGHPDEIDLKEAEDFGREMVEHSRRIYMGETELIPRFPTGKEYDDIYDPGSLPSMEIAIEFAKVRDRMQFKINSEKCNYPKCKLCVDNCPMNAIDFSGPEPIFDVRNCERCYLCIQTCPRSAIETDWLPFHKWHSQMMTPLEESLKIFEARGKFRRLVPMDKIGWNTFVWQLKNPIYKIP